MIVHEFWKKSFEIKLQKTHFLRSIFSKKSFRKFFFKDMEKKQGFGKKILEIKFLKKLFLKKKCNKNIWKFCFERV